MLRLTRRFLLVLKDWGCIKLIIVSADTYDFID